MVIVTVTVTLTLKVTAQSFSPFISEWHGQSWAVPLLPFISEFLKNDTPKPANSRQIMGGRAVSVEFHGQRAGYILTNNTVHKLHKKSNFLT
jgi:hypothetical protein